MEIPQTPQGPSARSIRKRVVHMVCQSVFVASAVLCLESYLFPTQSKPGGVAGFFSGTHSQLGNSASAQRNIGQTSAAVPARMGAKRYVDRGSYPPLDHIEGSLEATWNKNALSCPAGGYEAVLQDLRDRLSIETPLRLAARSCEKCPRGRFGSQPGLGSAEACTTCPPGRYGVRAGSATAEEACALCPEGTFGSERGLVTPACSGRCPAGTYGDGPGLALASQCRVCPRGYDGKQCSGAFHGSGLDGAPKSQYSGSRTGFGGRGWDTRIAASEMRKKDWDTATRGARRGPY
mmetsp:Transcript_27092/g.60560  ORF Transcript_27092/g.60560 Transcript_27092/m.60560 type:complete len:292 (+) Transcript_27092:91-966(+)